MNLLYQESIKFKQTYSRVFILLIGLSIITFLSAYFGMLALGQTTVDDLMRGIVDSLGGEETIKEKMESSEASFLFILKNNIRISIIILLSGLIPFYFATLFIGLPSIAIIGVVLANAQMHGDNPLFIFASGILPHGMTELTECFIVMSISLYLSHLITKRIFSKNKDTNIKQQIKANLQTFLVICVPLVVFSAIIEAYVTPIFSR